MTIFPFGPTSIDLFLSLFLTLTQIDPSKIHFLYFFETSLIFIKIGSLFISNENLYPGNYIKEIASNIIKNNKRGKYGSFNQMAAFERAFKLSKGEIIFLLDSDDYFHEKKLETIVNYFKNNEIVEKVNVQVKKEIKKEDKD